MISTLLLRVQVNTEPSRSAFVSCIVLLLFVPFLPPSASTFIYTIHNLLHPSLPAVKIEAPQSNADPPATDKECGFAQIPDLGQERSDPELRDAQKTSPANLFETDRLPFAASVNTEQQNQSRASENTEDAPKRSGCSPEPRHHSASQPLTRILKGRFRCIYEFDVCMILSEEVLCIEVSLVFSKGFFKVSKVKNH